MATTPGVDIGDGCSPNSVGRVSASSSVLQEITFNSKPAGAIMEDGCSHSTLSRCSSCTSTATAPAAVQATTSKSTPENRITKPDKEGHVGGGGGERLNLSMVSTGTNGLLSSPVSVLDEKGRSPSYGCRAQEQVPPDDGQVVGVQQKSCCLAEDSPSPGSPQAEPLSATLGRNSKLQIGCLRPKSTYPPSTSSLQAQIDGITIPAAPPEVANSDLVFSLEGVPSKRLELWQEELGKLGFVTFDGKKPIEAPTSITVMIARLTEASRGWSDNDHEMVGNLDGNQFFDFEPLPENLDGYAIFGTEPLESADLHMTTVADGGNDYFDSKLPDVLPKELEGVTGSKTEGGQLAEYSGEQSAKEDEKQETMDNTSHNFIGKSPSADFKSYYENGRADLLQAEHLGETPSKRLRQGRTSGQDSQPVESTNGEARYALRESPSFEELMKSHEGDGCDGSVPGGNGNGSYSK